jgi:hypothetical protein
MELVSRHCVLSADKYIVNNGQLTIETPLRGEKVA